MSLKGAVQDVLAHDVMQAAWQQLEFNSVRWPGGRGFNPAYLAEVWAVPCLWNVPPRAGARGFPISGETSPMHLMLMVPVLAAKYITLITQC